MKQHKTKTLRTKTDLVKVGWSRKNIRTGVLQNGKSCIGSSHPAAPNRFKPRVKLGGDLW